MPRKEQTMETDEGENLNPEAPQEDLKEKDTLPIKAETTTYALITPSQALEMMDKFLQALPYQSTASAYAPWYIDNIDGLVTSYRRSQLSHLFSDIRNPVVANFVIKFFTQELAVRNALLVNFKKFEKKISLYFIEKYKGIKDEITTLELGDAQQIKQSKGKRDALNINVDIAIFMQKIYKGEPLELKEQMAIVDNLIKEIYQKETWVDIAEVANKIPALAWLNTEFMIVLNLTPEDLLQLKSNAQVITKIGLEALHNFALHQGFPAVQKTIKDNARRNPPVSSWQASKAKAELDDRILNNKNKAVAEMVEQLAICFPPGSNKNPIIVHTNQLEAKYPCLIILFNLEYPEHKTKEILTDFDSPHGSYSKFLTHLLIACINKILRDNKVAPYFDKRQSFGFLSPTGADVGTAMRLSLGLVPNEKWKQCVMQGVQYFNDVLVALWDQKLITPGVYDKFAGPDTPMGAYANKLFLLHLPKENGSGLDMFFDFISKFSEKGGENGKFTNKFIAEDSAVEILKPLIDAMKEAVDAEKADNDSEFVDL